MNFWNFDPYRPPREKAPVGPARYLGSLFSSLGGLLLVNLAFLLCCLPVITIGPAMVALCRVCCNVLRGRTDALLSAFWKEFRRDLKRGVALTFTALPLLAWSAAATLAALEKQELPALTVLLAFLVMLVSFCSYLFLLVANTELSPLDLLRNSFILMLAGRQYSLAGAILTILLFGVQMLLLPRTLPILLLIGFSLVSYNSCFFAWKIADRYLFTPYYSAHPEEGVGEGYPS